MPVLKAKRKTKAAAPIAAVLDDVARAIARERNDIRPLLFSVTAQLGFDYVALAEHGDLRTRDAPLLVTNYPDPWRHLFIAEGLGRIDPVQRACSRRAAAFCWSELDRLIAPTPAQLALRQASRRHGLGDGVTVPLHVPGARAASCSFAVRPERALPREAVWVADPIARLIYDAVLALRVKAAAHQALSPRQRACVALLARGLTDRGIARELGLSEETVSKYLNAARARYGAARRTQLVALALRDGVIGFDDAVAR